MKRSDLCDTHVWPENWPAFCVLRDLQTQWRVGAAGPTGLDYMVLYRTLDRMGLSDEEYQEYVDDIRVMEFAALEEIHRKDD